MLLCTEGTLRVDGRKSRLGNQGLCIQASQSSISKSRRTASKPSILQISLGVKSLRLAGAVCATECLYGIV